jgi:hypothetical protein
MHRVLSWIIAFELVDAGAVMPGSSF